MNWTEHNQQAEYTAKLLTGCGCLLLPFCLLVLFAVLVVLAS